MWAIGFVAMVGFIMVGAILMGLAQRCPITEVDDNFCRNLLGAGSIFCVILSVLCILIVCVTLMEHNSVPESEDIVRCHTAKGTYSLEAEKCYRDGKELTFDEIYEHI